ncbi:MAG: MotA/TolQ/ExbB proton channel family protein [Acetatifactor sp.]|nr:MotA/TolQ/ExbB proton channel family protein [Acetatifactor sp.]
MVGFLGKYMNVIIIAGGVIVLFFLIKNYIKLYTKKSFIHDAMNRKNKETYLNASTGEVEEREKSEAVTPDTIRDYEKSFNEVVSGYNACTQFIPLFPLLGILGTVSGLLVQVKAQNIDEMFKSLDVALSSTFWGLIVTVILKICSTVSAKLIEDTEIVLDDYDKKIDNSVKLGNITSEEKG